ncbi:LytR C-terminal domain-containing protein [Nitrosomonas sp. Nm58]|uniref:LytR C-terminal domain-containing protein n=1 Tax=Nitrosomonas sp. Nm58 TaxID=200126 RepID=UPI000898A773|nr:LytR C-terminal domain-containing protein [Nitrosomonas sp. Nm58]SDY66575.1 Tetratricopeptide repeat-containing protein [Nitrosomonas sp. Nm58]
MRANKQKLAWTIGCLSVLAGCSSLYSSKEYAALQIKPVMHVQHADTRAQNLYHLGRYHHRKASYADAIAAYQKALAANPAYVEAHNGLGVIYSSQGQYPLALEHFQKAIELTPTATYLHNNLGYAHLLQGQNSEAAAAFQEALHFDPRNHKARRNLAAAHKRMGLNEPVAISSPEAKKPEENLSSIPQIQPVQPSANQQQLVQVASNIYEFKSDQEQPKAAAPLTAPTIHPAPIAHHHSEEPVSEKSVSVVQNKRIEVSNGNGVTGMAKNIALFLKRFGIDNARLTNHPTFQQAQTEIHYHSSASMLAEQISQIMPAQIKIVENNKLAEGIHLKILLGKDIASEVAYFTQEANMLLAQNQRL